MQGAMYVPWPPVTAAGRTGRCTGGELLIDATSLPSAVTRGWHSGAAGRGSAAQWHGAMYVPWPANGWHSGAAARGSAALAKVGPTVASGTVGGDGPSDGTSSSTPALHMERTVKYDTATHRLRELIRAIILPDCEREELPLEHYHRSTEATWYTKALLSNQSKVMGLLWPPAGCSVSSCLHSFGTFRLNSECGRCSFHRLPGFQTQPTGSTKPSGPPHSGRAGQPSFRPIAG